MGAAIIVGCWGWGMMIDSEIESEVDLYDFLFTLVKSTQTECSLSSIPVSYILYGWMRCGS